eukprot:TRINITY_DN3064_c0_g1_i2.p1 TRINITY_DN3064_c0_g1~~TRINITY_DN3064_c0_g1_i2.p1  ORF type:complete len:320 (-),score=73.18 TRINITY_DN3064_c0_g1_i2:178-1137(-)
MIPEFSLADSFSRGVEGRQVVEYSVTKAIKQKKIESPLEKYNRLRAEVDEFMCELQALQQDPVIIAEGIPSPNEIMQQMRILERDLESSLRFAQVSESHLNSRSDDSARQLLRKLDETAKLSHGDGNSQSTNTQVYHPSSLQTVEERIARLETTVGASLLPEGISNYRELASVLHEKLSIISDPTKLEGIRSRLAPLISQLESVSKAKHLPTKTTQDVDARIMRAFEILESWEKYSTTLPLLVERLMTLQDIHTGAAKVHTQVIEMDQEQKRLQELLHDNQNALQKLSSTFQENAKIIETNTRHLSSRMDLILSRLGGN